METRKINIRKTVQNILDKANRSNGMSIDVNGFNKKVEEEGESFVIEAAEFVGVEVSY